MEFYQQIAVSTTVVLVLFGLASLLKRRSGNFLATTRLLRSTPKKLQVVERIMFTPQQGLCLVRCGDRTILVAFAQSGCQILDDPMKEEVSQ